MLPLFLLFIAADIHTDFEGGSLGNIQKIGETHFRLAVKGESDQDNRNRQANWYSFRVDHATPGRELTLDIVNLPGEYNYRPNRGAITKDTPPVISFDNVKWTHVTTFEYDPSEPKLRLHITPASARFWVAHVPPYTNENLAKLRSEILGHKNFREVVIGKTLGGRDLLLWTIGPDHPAANSLVVWLFFRQHSWETGSSWAGEGAIRQLLRDDGGITWKIYPMCDPDGVARGGVRFNANGYDLNRNWDVVDPVKMPEITAQRKAIKAWLDGGHRIDFLLSLHNTETAEYLEGPPENGGKFKQFGERVFNILKEDTSFAPTRTLSFAESTTTAGKPGRMNVSQGLYRDFGLPGFIMEQRISMNPKLGHLPEIEDRLRFGSELVKAIGKALQTQ
jgi:hypothetical protein